MFVVRGAILLPLLSGLAAAPIHGFPAHCLPVHLVEEGLALFADFLAFFQVGLFETVLLVKKLVAAFKSLIGSCLETVPQSLVGGTSQGSPLGLQFLDTVGLELGIQGLLGQVLHALAQLDLLGLGDKPLPVPQFLQAAV